MTSVAATWKNHADDLRDWTLERMVNRDDCAGGYYVLPGGKVERTTRKAGDRYWRPLPQLLLEHYSAEQSGAVMGLHAISTEQTSMWMAHDVDAHGSERDDPEWNLQAALEIRERQRRGFGLNPIIIDSNGSGGFHVVTHFCSPAPSHVVYAFARRILRGLNPAIESFPKQPTTRDGGYGNWLRLPGRHHSRPVWSRILGDDGWLSPEGTILELLRVEGDSPDVLPAAPLPAAPPAVAVPDGEPIGDGEDWLVHYVAKVDEDGMARHDGGKWLAMQLRDARIPIEQAERNMVEYANRVRAIVTKEREYTNDEAIRTARDIYSTPARRPATRPSEERVVDVSCLRPTLPMPRANA